MKRSVLALLILLLLLIVVTWWLLRSSLPVLDGEVVMDLMRSRHRRTKETETNEPELHRIRPRCFGCSGGAPPHFADRNVIGRQARGLDNDLVLFGCPEALPMADRFFDASALIDGCCTQGWGWRIRLRSNLSVLSRRGRPSCRTLC